MTYMLICYATHPERADENASLIRNLCDELRSKQPKGFRYATFLADDGVTFFHFPFMDGRASPFERSPAFDAFKQNIKQRYRYAREPERIRLTELGAYNFYATLDNPDG